MIRFNANLFRIAFTCASQEETRYYLRGVFVEPHHQGGVTLTATDGHRLICVRDEAGFADESAIINLGDALKQCKPKRGERRDVVLYSNSNDAQIMLTTVDEKGALVDTPIAAAYAVKIDGTYPDYRRVVSMEFNNNGAPCFDGKYITAFAEIACDLTSIKGSKVRRSTSPIRVLPSVDMPETSPVLILFPGSDFIFGILMPIRASDDLSVPSWFRSIPNG